MKTGGRLVWLALGAAVLWAMQTAELAPIPVGASGGCGCTGADDGVPDDWTWPDAVPA